MTGILLAIDRPIATAFEFQQRTLEQNAPVVPRRLRITVSRSPGTRLHNDLGTIEGTVAGASEGVEQACEAIDEQFHTLERASPEASSKAEEGMTDFEDLTEASPETPAEQLEILAETPVEMEAGPSTFLEESEHRLDELQSGPESRFTDQNEVVQTRIEPLRKRIPAN